MKLGCLFSTLLLLLTTGSSYAEVPNKSVNVSDLKILSVSHGGYTIGGKPASDIYFGLDDNNYCAITFAPSEMEKEKSQKGQDIYVAYRNSSNNNPYIDITCQWSSATFLLSSKEIHDCYASLAIFDLDPKEKTATIVFTYKLLNIATANFPPEKLAYMNFPKYALKISESDFTELGLEIFN